MPSLTIETELATTPAEFWQSMSMDAVNAELGPLVRMTAPARWRSCPLEQWATGSVLFRSVVLLFGVVPVDVHGLRLERIDPEGGFLESSTSWMNRVWRHERTTAATKAGCVVRDTVTVESRVPGVAQLLLPVYRLVFRHRHRRLVAAYGVVASADGVTH